MSILSIYKEQTAFHDTDAVNRSNPNWLKLIAGRAKETALFLLIPVLFPSLVILAWWAATACSLVPENVLPSPFTVASTFCDLVSGGDLSANLEASLRRVALAVILGVPLGLGLGISLGFSETVEIWVGPTFRAIAQIPTIALIPLLMMVLGIEDSLKLFIMVKACVVPLAITTADGIKNIPKKYLEVGKILRLSRWRFVWKIILPGALPAIFTGLRQGISQVWVSLIAVEVLASADGIGYLMTWGRQIFQLDVVLVCVAVIGMIGFLLNFGLKKVEDYFLRWQRNGA